MEVPNQKDAQYKPNLEFLSNWATRVFVAVCVQYMEYWWCVACNTHTHNLMGFIHVYLYLDVYTKKYYARG